MTLEQLYSALVLSVLHQLLVSLREPLGLLNKIADMRRGTMILAERAFACLPSRPSSVDRMCKNHAIWRAKCYEGRGLRGRRAAGRDGLIEERRQRAGLLGVSYTIMQSQLLHSAVNKQASQSSSTSLSQIIKQNSSLYVFTFEQRLYKIAKKIAKNSYVQLHSQLVVQQCSYISSRQLKKSTKRNAAQLSDQEPLHLRNAENSLEAILPNALSHARTFDLTGLTVLLSPPN